MAPPRSTKQYNCLGHKVFILPKWKEHGARGGLKFAAKQWNADNFDGLNLYITPWFGPKVIQLQIGADRNEKIIMWVNGKQVIKKTSPKIITAGTWSEMWLQMRDAELQLGFKGVTKPFFEWFGSEDERFTPSYISFSSIKGRPIGYAFECHECLTEHTSVNNFNKTYSFGMWREENKDIYNNIKFNIRGTGNARILLTNLPGSGNQLIIEFFPKKDEVILNPIYNRAKVKPVIRRVKFSYSDTQWTTYHLSFTEYYLDMFINDTRLFTFESEAPLIFYWFSVAVKGGFINWSVNCEPLDLDGDPRDGGWSEWSNWVCPVTCGGGNGYRYRTCDNPKPNIYGNLCDGPATATGR